MAVKSPVIPEIAKAFENDPRTKIALQALAAGSNTSPVAQGKYAWADGLARVLQGSLGGYVQKKQLAKYGQDEQALLDLRRQRGEAGLAGLDAQAPQIAAALGAPPPAPTAPSAPQAPMSPVPAPQAPSQPAPGGIGVPPMLRAPPGTVPSRPLAPTAPASGLDAPNEVDSVEITADPSRAPVRRPDAPGVEPTTVSRRLRMAYQQLKDANRYESDGANNLMEKGLGDQTELDESATGRRQHVKDITYQSDLGAYHEDNQARRDQRFTTGEREASQDFTLTRDEKQYAHDMEKAGFDRSTAFGLAKMNNDADWQRTKAQIDASRATAEEKAQAKRNGFFNTATGAKLFNDTGTLVQANQDALDQVERFQALNAKRGTGGIILGGPAAGLETWRDGDLQAMDGISQSLRIALSKAIPGAISDKEGDAILKSVVTTKVGKRANDFAAARIKRVLERSNDYQTHKLEAMASGSQVPFMREWSAYRDSVSVNEPTSFEEWKSKVPKYDATGKRVN